MIDKWDGKTERRMNPDDHDKLTRTLVIVESLVKSFEAHVIEDKKCFGFINKTIWVGFGALGMLELILKINGK